VSIYIYLIASNTL